MQLHQLMQSLLYQLTSYEYYYVKNMTIPILAIKEQEQIVGEKIESENYRIDINTAYPRRGRMIPLTSIYSVTIRNDSVFSQLPYFGRAYSIPYGGGQGLMFNASIDQYTMAMGKRGYAVFMSIR